MITPFSSSVLEFCYGVVVSEVLVVYEVDGRRSTKLTMIMCGFPTRYQEENHQLRALASQPPAGTGFVGDSVTPTAQAPPQISRGPPSPSTIHRFPPNLTPAPAAEDSRRLASMMYPGPSGGPGGSPGGPNGHHHTFPILGQVRGAADRRSFPAPPPRDAKRMRMSQDG